MSEQHHQRVLTDLNPQHRALRHMNRGIYQGFAQLSNAALTQARWTETAKNSSCWPSEW
ncbi:putative alkylhydroperoxidase [Mycobacterium xenopi 3993]|nr:putative alkylhydroperoxidase [Mycobacterium xenopi 3993]